MALGASPRQFTQLIVAQCTRPVVWGARGVGLAASLATILIAMPTGAPISEIVRVTDPIAYVGSLLSIVSACLLAAWIPFARRPPRSDADTQAGMNVHPWGGCRMCR